jgi:chemosensory pili system protein ChpC
MARKKAKKNASARVATKKVGKKKTARKGSGPARQKLSGQSAIKHTRKPGVRKGSKKSRASKSPSREINCTLAPMGAETLLLPTNVIEEITDYQPPSALAGAPAWLLGQVEWENRQVPVISYGALINGSEPETASAKSRIMIIKSLSDSARIPYLGILLSDIPHLATLMKSMVVDASDDKKALGVFSRVKLENDESIIPDLDRLIHLVTHAAYGVLPITQVDV